MKYAVAIQDAFDRWRAPLSPAGDRKRARAMAHYLLVKGWTTYDGEIKAVQVIAWKGYDATRELVKAL